MASKVRWPFRAPPERSGRIEGGAGVRNMPPYLTVFGAGLLAGTMNALAGGGSFVTLPALISVGLPSVQANASSTVGLFPGGAASAWAYRDGLGPIGAVSLRRAGGSTGTCAGGACRAFAHGERHHRAVFRASVL
jgi:uncharacterized membrane protein YfcA